jgi:hypothetical protein
MSCVRVPRGKTGTVSLRSEKSYSAFSSNYSRGNWCLFLIIQGEMGVYSSLFKGEIGVYSTLSFDGRAEDKY